MDAFRQDLIDLLDGGKAHRPFDDVIAGINPNEIDRSLGGSPHTPWRLVEHLRITTLDIVHYVFDENYVEMAWPDDYWPQEEAPSGENDEARFAAFLRSADGFRQACQRLRERVEDEAVDPLAPLTPLAGGTSLARNIMLIADHNAWHVGQLASLLAMIRSRGDS
jgi:hypothetical protein